jgi:uncharacterized membrane protein
MSQLVALLFDDPYKADEARAALRRMEGEGLLDLEEMALISKLADGKTRISQETNVVAHDQRIGHVAGLVAAAVTGTFPFILVGTIGGRLIGMLRDNGITNRFVRDVNQALQPGTSALILIGSSDAERRRKIVERLRPFAPRLLESDLPPAVEAEVTQLLQKPPPA